MTQKRILITRHGIAPQDPKIGGSIDELVPYSVSNLFYKGSSNLRGYVRENGISPERAFLDHSNKKRTRDTGRAILVGALGLRPREGEFIPRSQEDLDRFDYDGVEMKEDPRLSYKDFVLNMDALQAEGTEGCTRRWVENPFAEEMDGKPITPFFYAIRRGRDYIQSAIGRAINGNKDFGVAATHGGSNADPIVMALLDTMRLEDIGGMFGMEDNVQLIMEESRGGVYTARLERDGRTYPVDLGRVLNQ